MKKILYSLGFTLLILVGVLYISDYSYLLRAVSKIYFTGHSTAFLSDYTRFDNHILPASSQSFQIWNASLSYRKDKDSKWEYEAKATNLLNISSQVRNSANTISVFNATTFIQPRFITARVVYSL